MTAPRIRSMLTEEGSAVSSCGMKVCINWCPSMTAVLDSGAAVNVMSFDYWRGMKNRASLDDGPSPSLLSVNGERLQVRGTVTVPVRVANILLQPKIRFFVIGDLPTNASVILGLEFIIQ